MSSDTPRKRLTATASFELEIRKSRFLAQAVHLPSPDEAPELIVRLSTPQVSHNCWAWLHGAQYRFSDDGEPGGTAGRPMLDVLRHQDLDGVLATVVRYFGGVKLGAGGLVRAYTDAVAQALLAAEKVPIVRLHSLRCQVPYALEGLLRREIEQAGASLEAVTHGSVVELAFSLPEDRADALVTRLNDLTHGRAGWIKP